MMIYYLTQSELSEEEVCEKQRKLLSGLPEFCVKDMASWFKLVAQFKPKLLQGLQVSNHTYRGERLACVSPQR